MARHLSHEDGRAVDLLLDRADSSADDGQTAGSFHVKNGKHNMDLRLRAVSRVLRVLDQMPAAEPSGDLVRKTLERIDHTMPAPAGEHLNSPQAYTADTRRHA